MGIGGEYAAVKGKTGRALPPVDEGKAIDVKAGEDTQSFLYNAIFFTATLVLGKFYGVASEDTPLHLIAFAIGNLIGPLVLGHFFDTIGRRKMIAITYVASGALLAISAFLFKAGALNAVTQTLAWCVIFFFFASARHHDHRRDRRAGLRRERRGPVAGGRRHAAQRGPARRDPGGGRGHAPLDLSAVGVGTGTAAVVPHDGLKVDFLITRTAATLGP